MPNISQEDELIIREFYERVATREDLFPDTPTKAKLLRGTCLGLLGYTVAFGKIVRPEDLETYTYGQRPDIEDRWERDTAALRSAVNGSDTREASASESSEDTEIR